MGTPRRWFAVCILPEAKGGIQVTHGTTDRLSTWCGRDVSDVHGYAGDEGDVECIDCLREEMGRLRFHGDEDDVECIDCLREFQQLLRAQGQPSKVTVSK